ncbi:MAG: RsmD family RNA methyltransferase, partial [Chloroflexota bacterium]
MRIGGGDAKGRQLKVPKGLFRPTTSLVKQAMFSMLESSGADWSRVLDLFAGSGALGIEALSRGADWSDFVDQERRTCTLIKENLKKADFLDRSHVFCSRVNSALAFLEGPYSIVFLDPPYSDPSLHKVLGQLAA